MLTVLADAVGSSFPPPQSGDLFPQEKAGVPQIKRLSFVAAREPVCGMCGALCEDRRGAEFPKLVNSGAQSSKSLLHRDIQHFKIPLFLRRVLAVVAQAGLERLLGSCDAAASASRIAGTAGTSRCAPRDLQHLIIDGGSKNTLNTFFSLRFRIF